MKSIKETRVKTVVSLCMALLLLAVVATPNIVKAAQRQNSNEWQFAAELYLWYASIGGSAGQEGDLRIDADDLIDGLNLAFMGNIAMRKNRWGFMLDALYLNASDNQNILTRSAGVNLNVELDGWVVNPMLGYLVVDSDNFSMNVVAGARYLDLSTDVDLRNADPSAASFNQRLSGSGSIWDAMIGVRGEVLLNANWFIPYHLDIGAGDSDFTWQAFGGLGYRFERFDILAGYRYLSWEFEDTAALDDLNLSGVGVGVKFYF